MADTTPDLLMTVEEIQAVTNRTLNADQAQSIAVQATSSVRDYCGWRIAGPADETFTLTPRRGSRCFLPSLHLNTVTTVILDGVTLVEGTDFDWDFPGILDRIAGRWPSKRRSLTVTVNHGYDVCPGSIAQAIAAAVARGTLTPAGGVVSEGTLGASLVYSRASAGGPAASAIFLPHELAVLDRHRVPVSR